MCGSLFVAEGHAKPVGRLHCGAFGFRGASSDICCFPTTVSDASGSILDRLIVSPGAYDVSGADANACAVPEVPVTGCVAMALPGVCGALYMQEGARPRFRFVPVSGEVSEIPLPQLRVPISDMDDPLLPPRVVQIERFVESGEYAVIGAALGLVWQSTHLWRSGAPAAERAGEVLSHSDVREPCRHALVRQTSFTTTRSPSTLPMSEGQTRIWVRTA